MPTSGLQTDKLIGAGCVAMMESAGVTLDELGQAPRFAAAVKAGEVRLLDSAYRVIVSPPILGAAAMLQNEMGSVGRRVSEPYPSFARRVWQFGRAI